MHRLHHSLHPAGTVRQALHMSWKQQTEEWDEDRKNTGKCAETVGVQADPHEAPGGAGGRWRGGRLCRDEAGGG